jgi:hypothetical protein
VKGDRICPWTMASSPVEAVEAGIMSVEVSRYVEMS